MLFGRSHIGRRLRTVGDLTDGPTQSEGQKRLILRASGCDLIVFTSLKIWGRPVSTGMLKVWLRVRRPKHDVNTFGTYNCQR